MAVRDVELALFGSARNRATATTTNATNTDLTFTRRPLTLRDNSTLHVTVQVAAIRTDSGTEYAGYGLSGTFRRASGAASVAAVAVTQGSVHESDSTWNATLAADTTNGGFKVTVTGAAGKTIKWVAKVTSIVEVTK